MAIWILYSTAARSDLTAIDLLLILYTVAILNLLDLRSIMGCPGGTRSVFTCAFWAKRELQCIFLEKGDHYYIQMWHNDFFSHYSRVNTDVNVSDRAHAPWVSHNTP